MAQRKGSPSGTRLSSHCHAWRSISWSASSSLLYKQQNWQCWHAGIFQVLVLKLAAGRWRGGCRRQGSCRYHMLVCGSPEDNSIHILGGNGTRKEHKEHKDMYRWSTACIISSLLCGSCKDETEIKKRNCWLQIGAEALWTSTSGLVIQDFILFICSSPFSYSEMGCARERSCMCELICMFLRNTPDVSHKRVFQTCIFISKTL